MDELLGPYYNIIIQHFSEYLPKSGYEDNVETMELVNQILTFEEEQIDSKRIIFHHADLLEKKTHDNGLINIICFIFELHLFYIEEALGSIQNLKDHKLLNKDSKNYLLFIEKVIEVEYSDDNQLIGNFKKMLKVMPEDFEVVRILWGSYYSEKSTEVILEMVDLVDPHEPFNDSVMHFKAFYLKEIGDYENALSVYKSILEHDLKRNHSSHKKAWDYLFISDCHLKLDNLKEAIDSVNVSFRNLGELEDSDLKILLLNIRGEALVHQNKIQLAIKDFKETLKLDEANVTALSFLEEYS